MPFTLCGINYNRVWSEYIGRSMKCIIGFDTFKATTRKSFKCLRTHAGEFPALSTDDRIKANI